MRRPRTVSRCKSQNQSQPRGGPIFCGRNCRQRADEHNLALRPTLTPDKHARARPRHGPGPQRHPCRNSGDPARHGLNPPPTPPHKLKRPHLRVGITGRGPVPNAGAGHGGSVSHLPASAACRHRRSIKVDKFFARIAPPPFFIRPTTSDIIR